MSASATSARQRITTMTKEPVGVGSAVMVSHEHAGVLRLGYDRGRVLFC